MRNAPPTTHQARQPWWNNPLRKHPPAGRRRRMVAVLSAAALTLALPFSAFAAPPLAGPATDQEILLKAQPDECFQGIGEGPLPINDDGTCPEGSQPRTTGAYVWSTATAGDWTYIGTGPNVVCSIPAIFAEGDFSPFATEHNVCEVEEGPTVDQYGPAFGDNRLPQVFRVNHLTDEVEDITPVDDPNLGRIFGLRGSFESPNGDVVMLSGQVFDSSGATIGSGLYAWQASTGEYLGSTVREDLGAFRFGIQTSDGNSYAVARTATTEEGAPRGVVLRWTGSVADPFQFEQVGDLPNEAFFMTEHEGKLAVATSPFTNTRLGGAQEAGPGEVYLSPELGEDGLTPEDQTAWTSIFDFSDYDPDPTIGNLVSMGAITSWRGHLIAGTYQLDSQLGATKTLWNEFGRPDSEGERLQDAKGASRPVTVFDITNAGADNQRTTLLYGQEYLPVRGADGWSLERNGLNQVPKYGPAGFGNAFNAYSWSFKVFQDRLYMGTFDVSGAMEAIAPFATREGTLAVSPQTETLMENVLGPALNREQGGADLWRMDSPDQPAVPESLDGFGNTSNHGVRVLVPLDEEGFMYVGTAADHNLRSPDMENPGGFEFIKLTPSASENEAIDTNPPEITLTAAKSVERPRRGVDFEVNINDVGRHAYTVCINTPAGYRFTDPDVEMFGRQACKVVGPNGAIGDAILPDTIRSLAIDSPVENCLPVARGTGTTRLVPGDLANGPGASRSNVRVAALASPGPSSSPSGSPTEPEPTPTVTASPSPTPSATPSQSPSASPTPSPTASPTPPPDSDVTVVFHAVMQPRAQAGNATAVADVIPSATCGSAYLATTGAIG